MAARIVGPGEDAPVRYRLVGLAVLVADVPECARRVGDLAVAVRAILDLDVVDALGPGAPVGEELGQVVREAGVDAALMLAPRLDAAASSS